MRLLAVYNIKGGVGKTATAVNLGCLAAREQRRTLIWDLDPQGAASFYFRIKPKVKGGWRKLQGGKRRVDNRIKGTDFDRLDLLPADFSFRHLDLELGAAKRPTGQLQRVLRPLADDYDLVVLDCPPSISLVSENVFSVADALLLPVIPTTLSLRTLEQLRRFLARGPLKTLPLLPFYSMVDPAMEMHRQVLERLPPGRDGFLESQIPYAADVERMGIERAPVLEYAPDSPAAQAYRELWNEVRERLF
jgi:cellulose biosynthesis protein BcsQ